MPGPPKNQPVRTVLERFIREAPKAELHVHLRGAMPHSYFLDQVKKYPPRKVLEQAPEGYQYQFLGCENICALVNAPRPDRGAVESLFGFETFEQFLLTYFFTSFFIREPDDFRRLVDAVVEASREQGIVYTEITVSVVEYLDRGLKLTDLLDAMNSAANRPGPGVRWIVDLVRNVGGIRAEEVLDAVLADRPASVAGITLGGSEEIYPAADFARAYEKARGAGLRLTVHAGEALGPESVWDVLKQLRVERIGHGVRSIDDPRLVEHLAMKGIPLEICPASNIRTGVFGSYREHPVKKLHDAGVPVNISSDDPGFFGATLTDELLRLPELGFTEPEVVGLMRNGFRHAFLDEAAKAGYLNDFEAFRERSMIPD